MFGNFYTYDIETYPNCFTFAAKRLSDGARWVFELSSRRDDSRELLSFLYALIHEQPYMVGFNNINFDYPVVHAFINSGGTLGCDGAYDLAQQIFDHSAPKVWESDHHIPQLDLYLINHFNNKARRTSLKACEFYFRVPNLQDLPFRPGTFLTSEQIDVLIDYNINGDVENTEVLLKHCMKDIEFRETLTKKYGKSFMNFNDTKIGKQYFIMRLEQAGIACYENRQPRQTPRDQIHLRDALLPYINFEQPAFQHVHRWLWNETINDTKGVFESILVPHEMVQYMNPDLIRVSGDGFDREKLTPALAARADLTFRSGWQNQSGLNCIIKGFEYVFGTGGIHGSIESQTVVSDGDWIVEDWDVASYYPNIAIANRIFPAHLGEEFCDIYQDVYVQRKQHAKGTPENAAMKLALNGVYGDSNSQFSPFYDPLYTMTITINGQLLLCMLSEWLMSVYDLSMVQINTDGLTIRYPRRAQQAVHEICKRWEDFTRLTLEHVEYRRMFIRDVNNYIAEDTTGKIKRKGAYEYERELHQNHSGMIIPIVAERALLHGESIEANVLRHRDIYDFMMFTKVSQGERLELDGEEVQRRCRYYVSTEGGKLVAVRPPPADKVVGDYKKASGCPDWFYNDRNCPGVWDPEIHTKNKSVYGMRSTEVEKGYKCTLANDMMTAVNPINYQYYIDRIKKLVEPLR